MDPWKFKIENLWPHAEVRSAVFCNGRAVVLLFTAPANQDRLLLREITVQNVRDHE